MAADPWRAAGLSMLRHGQVQSGDPEHLVQHPVCAVAGQPHERIYTRCCSAVVDLPRPLWPCEIPIDIEMPTDCCARPWVLFGPSDT